MKEVHNLFNEYSSNTFAGTCNNYMIKDSVKSKTSAIFYRVQKSGKQIYRFCFSNVIDSTWGDGTLFHANQNGGCWKIISAFAGDGGAYGEPQTETGGLVPVLFSASAEKSIAPGEVFWSDETELEIPQGHYLCFKLTFCGSGIPYMPEKLTPYFSFNENEVIDNRDFPQPIFVGIKDGRRKKIVFLGDSITQGIGTTQDKYGFWAAKFAERLNGKFSVWNIGLGCGRAGDAASDGVWLNKAKTADIVFVCLGVNDIFMHRSVSEICGDILKIICLLKKNGCRVFLLSVPPFDMIGEDRDKWYAVNEYLKSAVSKEAEGFFDVSSVLGKPAPNSHMSLFGPHPDDNGGEALGNALYNAFGDKL